MNPFLQRPHRQDKPESDQPDQIDMMDADEVRSEFRKMLAALHEIARYDKDSKHGQGICPYGCDCPHIAQTALGFNAPREVTEAKLNSNDLLAPHGLRLVDRADG